MESPASCVRRRAWINSSRQQPTVEDTDSQLTSVTDDDDVFFTGQANSAGCCTGNIEKWFLSCRSTGSPSADQSFELPLGSRSIDDGLDIGADANVLNNYNTLFPGECHNGVTSSGACQRGFVPSQSLGHTSFNSSATWNSTTSVTEVLQSCSENAEDMLYELGFGHDNPQVTVRIPPRFLNFPSQSKGINFRLFLDAQLQRMREEDPSLSLASRFRQVQMLTEMANAFYSLYSHVSRTPVQKLPTPVFNFPTPDERMERFRSSVRSDPRSPVDKLKDTVSKMCLYAGSHWAADSPTPSPKRQVSFPDLVDLVWEKPSHATNQEIKPCDFSAADDDQGSHNGSTNSGLGCSKDFDITQTEGSSLIPGSRSHGCDAEPLVRTSYEHICNQIVERVHRAPFNLPLATTDTVRLPVKATAESPAKDTSPVFSRATRRTENNSKPKHLSAEPLIDCNLPQANSFELEEVHSAGEDDLGQSEESKPVRPKTSASHFPGEIVRGDSLQSDSSGYADDVPPEHQS